MMFKSAYACILVYLLSSGVLNYVVAASGLFSPLVLLFGLVVVLGFALMLKNVKASDFFVTAFVTFLAVYVVLAISGYRFGKAAVQQLEENGFSDSERG